MSCFSKMIGSTLITTYDIEQHSDWISQLLSKRSYNYKSRMQNTVQKKWITKKKKKKSNRLLRTRSMFVDHELEFVDIDAK
jgi:hypothetical protein